MLDELVYTMHTSQRGDAYVAMVVEHRMLGDVRVPTGEIHVTEPHGTRDGARTEGSQWLRNKGIHVAAVYQSEGK